MLLFLLARRFFIEFIVCGPKPDIQTPDLFSSSKDPPHVVFARIA